MAGAGEVGRDVRGARGDRYPAGEVQFLPAGRGLVAERARREQRPGGTPQAADMRAGVVHLLVEPDAGDEPAAGGLELHAQVHRAGVGRVHRTRGCCVLPDAARALGHRAGGEAPGERAAHRRAGAVLRPRRRRGVGGAACQRAGGRERRDRVGGVEAHCPGDGVVRRVLHRERDRAARHRLRERRRRRRRHRVARRPRARRDTRHRRWRSSRRTGRGVLPRHRNSGCLPASQEGVARSGRTMIITQTPLRIGLLGGGTALSDYYREHGGRVLNCALDKYVYVIVKQRFDDDIYVNYSKKEIVSRVEDLEHELVREAMQMTGVANGVEIPTLADIPSAGGSGLGSSSAVTVGLLHALLAYQGRQVSAEELADRACTIEIERCGKPIGKQDQYIAALGGIRDIHFGPGDGVVAEELGLDAADRRALQQQIMLFYTGVTRSANTILAEQNANIEATRPQLDLLRDLAGFAVERLRSGDMDAIGPALRESWEAKLRLASAVSIDKIDRAVTRSLVAGASGAKLTEAGGGGFLLLTGPMDPQRP